MCFLLFYPVLNITYPLVVNLFSVPSLPVIGGEILPSSGVHLTLCQSPLLSIDIKDMWVTMSTPCLISQNVQNLIGNNDAVQ